MRILVVEDEKKVASFIKRGLEEESFSVDMAYDGEEGLYMAESNPYDLILMDLMLPKMDGLAVIKELGRHGYPVSSGTMYPMLHEIERVGYLSCTESIVGRKVRQ